MPCRLAKPAACPLVGEATVTTSLSYGMAFTAAAMHSAWKREPTIPILTWSCRIFMGLKLRAKWRGAQGKRAVQAFASNGQVRLFHDHPAKHTTPSSSAPNPKAITVDGVVAKMK